VEVVLRWGVHWYFFKSRFPKKKWHKPNIDTEVNKDNTSIS